MRSWSKHASAPVMPRINQQLKWRHVVDPDSIAPSRHSNMLPSCETDLRGSQSSVPACADCSPNDISFMRIALSEAREAYRSGEVPVGAVLVDFNGKIVGIGRNRVEEHCDPTRHAEMEALRTGPQGYGWRRLKCTLYTTLEPCAMCCAAASLARVSRIVFGAPDLRLGACGTWIDFPAYRHPFHKFDDVVGGVCADEAALLMRTFFKQRRERS